MPVALAAMMSGDYKEQGQPSKTEMHMNLGLALGSHTRLNQPCAGRRGILRPVEKTGARWRCA